MIYFKLERRNKAKGEKRRNRTTKFFKQFPLTLCPNKEPATVKNVFVILHLMGNQSSFSSSN